jgi:hypothetical protein
LNVCLAVFLILILNNLIYETYASDIDSVKAVNLLYQKLESDSVYTSWTEMECLYFIIMDSSSDYFDIAVHEKHDQNCPGNPNTAPRVDTFRIMRQTNEILWYNLFKDSYESYNEFLNKRLKRL